MSWLGPPPPEEERRLGAAEGGRVLRRTLAMLAPQRLAALGALATMVAATVCQLAGPALFGYGIDHGLRAHSMAVVGWSAAAYLAVSLAAVVLGRAQILLVTRVGERFLYDLRVRVFDHILAMSMEFFDGERTGRLVSRMTADINALEDLVQQGLLIFVTNLILILVAVVVLVVQSAVMFALCLVSTPVLWLRSRRFKADSDVAYLEVRDRISQTLTALQEGITGVRVIQAFGREDSQTQRFAARNRAQLDANMRATRIAAFYFPVVELSGVATVAALVGVGGLLVHSGVVQIGTVVAFVLYVNNLYDPIQQMSQLFNLVQQGAAALHKLFSLLDTRTTLPESPGAVDLPERGDIVLSGVGFSYAAEAGPHGERRLGPPILEGVDLTVRHGERLALVGPTGAGKSTLAKLIARFYDPTAGSVTYGGVDLRRAKLACLRQRVAVLPQEGYLFSGTVLDNVRMARPGASEQDVRRALAVIGAEHRFDALPQGLLTEVRERGSLLSAGERQLVSLARAALADPQVLILDEATSSLDPGTEAEVEAAMAALLRGRTVIIIAHRLSTAERADRVAVVEGGRLVEVGTHAELVGAGGAYSRIYAAWAGSRAA
ncbi:MAG TPA: ABC transporter ATP-binding protein [Acidimicrobiales bacterium]|nr:ABC transporter ATP-binding protein [Acidimicrobiales bacterium]